MNGLFNENQLATVKKYEFLELPIHKIDSLNDNCFRDCHEKYFHTFEDRCVYNIKLTNIGIKDTVKLTISDKSMDLYKLIKKLKIARQRVFIFNQINKQTRKTYSLERYINIHFKLKLQIPIMHRQFLKIISQNKEYIKQFCNYMENPFHFACRKWYLYNNPQY